MIDRKINKQAGSGPADEKEGGGNGIMQAKRKVLYISTKSRCK